MVIVDIEVERRLTSKVNYNLDSRPIKKYKYGSRSSSDIFLDPDSIQIRTNFMGPGSSQSIQTRPIYTPTKYYCLAIKTLKFSLITSVSYAKHLSYYFALSCYFVCILLCSN